MPEGIGYGKAARKRVSSKIRKVKQDSPGLSQKQAAGKAIGILKHDADKAAGKKYSGARKLGA